MKKPISESEIPWETWYKGTDREVKMKALCDIGDEAKFGFGLMELPPGSNTRPSHLHSHEEEHLMVLSGTATLHLGSDIYLLKSGSYICFPSGQELMHHIENTGNEPFRYIMVGERIEHDKVTHETES